MLNNIHDMEDNMDTNNRLNNIVSSTTIQYIRTGNIVIPSSSSSKRNLNSITTNSHIDDTEEYNSNNLIMNKIMNSRHDIDANDIDRFLKKIDDKKNKHKIDDSFGDSEPTYEPTHKPTHEPTHKPTHEPTYEPTITFKPTHSPTYSPTTYISPSDYAYIGAASTVGFFLILYFIIPSSWWIGKKSPPEETSSLLGRRREAPLIIPPPPEQENP